MKKLSVILALVLAAAFMFTACQKNEGGNAGAVCDRPAADVYEDAVAGLEFPMMMPLDDESLGMIYSVMTADDMADYCINVPMANISATEIAVIKPADGKTDAVKEGLNARVDDLIATWEHYLPDQYELVQNHQIVEKNGMILFVISEDADTIVSQFEAAVE